MSHHFFRVEAVVTHIQNKTKNEEKVYFQEFAQIPEPPCVKEIADRKIHQPFVNDFLPPYPGKTIFHLKFPLEFWSEIYRFLKIYFSRATYLYKFGGSMFECI